MSKAVEGEGITRSSTNWKGKIKMTKEERNAVKEVEVVLGVKIEKYLEEKKDIPYEVMEEVVKKILEIEADYNKTKKELLFCNSSAVKLERLLEIIGTVSTISVEDEESLDKTLDVLDKILNS